MTKAFIVIAAIVPLLAASHAYGQSGTSATSSSAASNGIFLEQDDKTLWRASKLVGTSVNGPDDVKIGTVGDILFDSSGNARAVVIQMNEQGDAAANTTRTVAMPFTSLTISRSTSGDSIDKVSIVYRKDELAKAPAFKWSDAANNSTRP
jgi:hypothetical protein